MVVLQILPIFAVPITHVEKHLANRTIFALKSRLITLNQRQKAIKMNLKNLFILLIGAVSLSSCKNGLFGKKKFENKLADATHSFFLLNGLSDPKTGNYFLFGQHLVDLYAQRDRDR